MAVAPLSGSAYFAEGLRLLIRPGMRRFVVFTLTMLANLVAAAFIGLLSEEVKVPVRGQDDFPPFSLTELMIMVPRTPQRELRKLGYYLPWALGLLVLTFIPGLNLTTAPLWILFGVWMMAVQYIDLPADNHKLDFRSMLAWLRTHRLPCLGFGGAPYLPLLVPDLNALFRPAVVAGATLFWVCEDGGQALPNSVA